MGYSTYSTEQHNFLIQQEQYHVVCQKSGIVKITVTLQMSYLSMNIIKTKR